MFAYCGNNPVCYEDITGMIRVSFSYSMFDGGIPEESTPTESGKDTSNYRGTLSLGVSLGINVGPWTWGGQACFSFDANGYLAFQYGIIEGISAGPDSNSISNSVNISPFAMITNANGYRGLEENGIQMGASYPPYIVDYVILLDSNGQTVTGQGICIGGWPSSIDAHIAWSYVWTAAAVKFDWDTFYKVTQY